MVTVMDMERNTRPRLRATTVLAVRKDGRAVMAGDGQVSMGETIMKQKARKVRFMYEDQVLVGFAGAAADAFSRRRENTSHAMAHAPAAASDA